MRERLRGLRTEIEGFVQVKGVDGQEDERMRG